MVDIMSREERSKRMSLIKGKWTKQEKWMHDYLKGHKIKHKMHPRMEGSPDIIFPQRKIALMLHGCFWHGCKKCYRAPSSNKKFWENKLEHNRNKDNLDAKKLKQTKWKVVTIWEHEIPRHYPKKKIMKTINNIIYSRVLRKI